MSKIKTLREDVYKKIAAGEVVERPLSVVKELVENSIDAGADAITVELAEGGKRSIIVTDNGSGFDAGDIETAFKNHSTSKISELSDFDSLHTLGFRGEALPSIMEVSKIEVKTSNSDDGSGFYCRLEGGKLLEKDSVACNRGTMMAVKDLFYNFPVRKKFMKTERTELNRITALLEPMALVNYDKSFDLLHNGRTVFSYKKTAHLKERIYQVFGKEFLDSLQEINYQQGDYNVNGFVSRLNTGLSVKKHQYFFVNHRSVREKTMFAALSNTFKRYLEKHRFPVAILMLDFPPSEVDVNIHPMKLEIKFVDSSRIYQFIKRAIDSCFGGADNFLEDLDAFAGSRDLSTSAGQGYGVYSGSNSNAGESGGIRPQVGNYSYAYRDSRSGFPRDEEGREPARPASQADLEPAGTPGMDEFQQAQLFSGHFMEKEEFTIIGQYQNSYIIVEKEGELLIVDQHNAQERVNFDQLKLEYNRGNVTSISPLFPVIIELTPSEAEQLGQTKLDMLSKAGFRLEPLGGNSYDIKSFPQILGERSIKDAVREVIHMKEKEADIEFEDVVLREIACKSAIKINHRLYPDQMKTIVRNLFQTENPYFCPHKRPIIIEMTLEKIEKLMKRR